MRRPFRNAVLPSLVLAFCSGLAGSQEDDARPPRFAIDEKERAVVARDADGKLRWSTRLDGYLGGVRPPHILWDARRVYLTREDGVTALDAETGKLLWHAKGPNNCLLLSG